MANHLRTELVLEALNMAIWQRRPESVIHHSDQGTQYTSIAFGHRCKQLGVRPSTGSARDCYDNAMAESFFATLETELLWRQSFKSQVEARMAVFEFIEGFYNPRRRHSRGARQPIPNRLREELLRDPVTGCGNCRTHADRAAIRTATWKPLCGSHEFPQHYARDAPVGGDPSRGGHHRGRLDLRRRELMR